MMLGAIAGDVIGSVHEFIATKTTDFELFPEGSRFTDDSVLTVAVADCLLHGRDYVDAFHDYFGCYPNAGYGFRFFGWASAGQRQPYNSWGNGSAMRVSPVAYAFASFDDVLEHAARSARVTHDHPEGVKGAQATAAAIYLAEHGESKDCIRHELERRFGYDLGYRLDDIRPTYKFDESCMRTVPPAIIAFLESDDFEDAVRKSISLGGDADTLACITGGIAEAYYGGVPEPIRTQTLARLDGRLRGIVEKFSGRYLAPTRHSAD
jgi:ADP-ribosylglycohydrolase